MDVKCERCNTEYEFDDALVSGRGTTVKCTNCGHKFKIRRGDGDFSEDFWNVTTGDGRTLVFTSLRELQRAIQSYLVERNDRLSRGGLPPKAIGQIPELLPFFEQREAARKSQQSARPFKTQDGLGPAAAAALAQQQGEIAVRARQATTPEFPAPPSSPPNTGVPAGKTTLIGTGHIEVGGGSARAELEATVPLAPPIPSPAPRLSAPPVPVRSSAPPVHAAASPSLPPPVPPRRDSVNTAPLRRPSLPPPVPVRTGTASMPPPLPERARRSSEQPAGARGSLPAGPGPSHRPAPPLPHDGDVSSPLPPRGHRSLVEEFEGEGDRYRGPSSSLPDGPPSRRRSVGGFIVSAVVVGCLLMLGAVWAQKNLGTALGTKPAAPTAAVDPRVATFLAAGEAALAAGNIDLAKESLDKASALSEKDPHVLVGLARLAAVRADGMWLKSRLLPPDAVDEQRITRDGLSELATSARKAVDEALAVAPADPAALRAKIDALRIAGDRDGARALVGKSAPSSTDPESAYVLAALDLAEAEPLWPTVVSRLKVAANAETGPGRARAALVFALARSGDIPGARTELDRLNALSKPHPLFLLLRAFVDHSKSASALDAGAADAGRAIAEVHDAGKAAAGRGVMPSDPRELVTQGERARARGEYDRARTYFSAAAEKNPNDSEALAGLAAISYAQRDLSGARAAYKRVLAINPNYMPALVGLADVEWDSGDKGSAAKLYKDIVDRYPEGAYPGRAKQRAEGGGG